MKKAIFSAVLFAMLFVFASCGESVYTDVSYGMGADITQKVYGNGGEDAVSEVKKAIEEAEKQISYRIENSDIYKLNSLCDGETSQITSKMIDESILLSEKTDGAYDITVLPLVKLWGFDGENMQKPADEEIAACLKTVSYKNIEKTGENTYKLNNNASIDLSALGKGLACDIAVDIYKEHGLSGGIVTVGGSVGVFGYKDSGEEFTVAIRNPFDKTDYIATLKLTDAFISTSGSYEKSFSEGETLYHHILNPLTGYPFSSGLISVTVICKSGYLSDMLSSACFALGKENSLALLEEYDADAVFIAENGEISVTSGIKDIFECNENWDEAK